MAAIFNSRMQADSLSFECPARAAFIQGVPFLSRIRMEPRESSPPTNVFDQPPRETEALASRETDVPPSTLAGDMEVPDVPDTAEPSDLKEEMGESTTREKSPPVSLPTAATEQEALSPSHRDEVGKAEQLGLSSREEVGVIASARHANLRRTPHFWKIMVLTFLANVLVLVGAGYWLQRRLMAEIASRPSDGTAGTTPPALTPPDAASGANEGSAQLEALLKRLDDAEEQNRRQSTRLEELASALAAAKSGIEVKKAGPATGANPGSEILSPANNELILLKERNRLTAYADECIASGARAPYEQLWEALDDPRLTNLVHAARAEILRVQNFYLGGSRIDRFDIPVATYYPDDAALRDSQLKDDQLVKLLLTKKNPWEVRMKAANLLGTRRSLEVGDALVEAVKRDENLDVVKEATFSFEVMTGFRSRIFDAAALEQWWKQFKATPPPVPPKPKAATDAKTPPEAKTGSDANVGTDGKASKPAAKADKGGTPAPAPSSKESSSKTGMKADGKSTGSKTKKK
jgi:hypothetical protein